MEISKLYIELINNPFAAKTYRSLAKYYESINQQNNADAFWHAIDVKYESNHSHPDQRSSD